MPRPVGRPRKLTEDGRLDEFIELYRSMSPEHRMRAYDRLRGFEAALSPPRPLLADDTAEKEDVQSLVT